MRDLHEVRHLEDGEAAEGNGAPRSVRARRPRRSGPRGPPRGRAGRAPASRRTRRPRRAPRALRSPPRFLDPRARAWSTSTCRIARAAVPMKVRPIAPRRPAVIDELQPGLVDQRRGLQRVIGPLSAQVRARQAVQLVVQQRKELLARPPVSIGEPAEQHVRLRFGPIFHGSSRPSLETRSGHDSPRAHRDAQAGRDDPPRSAGREGLHATRKTGSGSNHHRVFPFSPGTGVERRPVRAPGEPRAQADSGSASSRRRLRGGAVGRRASGPPSEENALRRPEPNPSTVARTSSTSSCERSTRSS